MKAKLIFAGILLSLALGALWLSGHGYVQLGSADGQEVTYQLLSQGDTQSKPRTISGGFKKLVSKGTYEVVVRNKDGSYITAVTVKGFLSNASVTPELKGQNARSFIGDNPSSCMYPFDERLLSIPCEDSFDQLKIHKPATAKVPTITVHPTTPPVGFVEGVVATKEGDWVLLRDDATSTHTIYRLNAEGQTSGGKKLSSLEGSQPYKISPYKDGFVVYNTDGSQIHVYSSVSAAQTSVAFGNTPKGLSFAGVITSGQQLAAVYSDKPDREVPSLSQTEGEEVHSVDFDSKSGTGDVKAQAEVVVYGQDSQLQHYRFAVPSAGIGFCGSNKLCTHNNGTVSVYDIASGKAQLLYQLHQIDAISYQANGFVAVQDQDIISFDTATQQGYVSLHLEDLTPCGLQIAEKGYVVCTQDAKGKRAALRVDLTQPQKGAIDASIGKLADTDGVVSVSVYGRYIFITPETPEETWNAEDRAFEYDANEVSRTNARINSKIDELDISRNDYTIVFTVR